MMAASRVGSWIATVLNTRILAYAMLTLAPLVLLAILFTEPLWLRAAIVTISAFIAMERSGLTPVGVIIHGIAIAAGFMALLAGLMMPALFVAGTVAMAAGSILLTARGANLRSLGNFTFIPALYLACETAEGAAPDQLVARGVAFLPFLAVALIPVIFASIVIHHRSLRESAAGRLHYLTSIFRGTEFGAIAPYWESMITVALAVGVAASLVEWRHIDHGQWVIWSAASIVTGDAASARVKLRDRVVGALLGVPAGIGLGLLLPHDGFTYGLATLATVVTLVAFRRYVLGFGLRCAGAALALVLAGQSTVIAAERASNVIIGGVIGLIFVLIIHAIMTARPPKPGMQGGGAA